MTGIGSVYVELKGIFTFSINQSGLDFKNKEEKQHAVDDFWDCWEEFVMKCERNDHSPSFSYKREDLKVRESE